MATLETVYGNDPWTNIETNQRTWYDPTLSAVYRQNTLYTNMIPYASQNLLPMNAKSMVFNFMYDYATQIDPSPSLRYFEKDPAYIDGMQVEIGFERYQWQTALDKYDSMISYWRQNGEAGLMPIIRERIGRNMVESMDLLIRNAFLSTTYVNLPSSGYTGADQLTQSDKFTLDMVDDSILRAQVQNAFAPPAPGLNSGQILCVGSPGQHYDIITEPTGTSKWIELQKYTSQTPFNRYEIGAYHNSRHMTTNANILWNCGATTYSKTITTAADALDGAPDPATTKVDGVYKVGQAGANATHYLQLNSVAGVQVGQIVTIHKRKNQSADVAANPKLRVLGAPKFDDGWFITRRVVSVDAVNGRIAVDRPLLLDYTKEINASGTGAEQAGTGVYGFVTFGLSLHVNIMIAQPNAIVCGVMAPPRFYAPAPIDTYDSVYRFAWDAYMKYQLIKPEAYEIFVTSGTVRVKDQKQH